jgi:Flp pilus assembly protein TadG
MVGKAHTNGLAKPGLHRLRMSVRDDRGGAAVEFGILAPLFLMLVLGIVQFALTFADYMFLTSAVMAGSQTLSVSRGITLPFTSTVDAMVASAPLLTAAQLKANIKITVNGAVCVTDSACAAKLNSAAGDVAVVTASYPCDLTIFGVNYVPGCTLATQVAQVVQ